MAHTKGEWKRGSNWAGTCVVKTEITDICKVYNAESDAQLIAAVPDLLEALKQFVVSAQFHNEQNTKYATAYDSAIKAINKTK